MKQHYPLLARHWNWWPDNLLSQRKLPQHMQPWVDDKGSLTSALIELGGGDFKVHVLNQVVSLPYHHEHRKLSCLLHQAAMIREVELVVSGHPVVFARSIIPLELINRGQNGLANIGRTPLGHLLFKNGKIRVSKRELTQLRVNKETIVARRTPYDFEGSQILVAEFFLPGFQELL